MWVIKVKTPRGWLFWMGGSGFTNHSRLAKIIQDVTTLESSRSRLMITQQLKEEGIEIIRIDSQDS